MNLKDLPVNYKAWLIARKEHLDNDLQKSKYTVDLFRQYKKHLGSIRYRILVEAQMLVVPDKVKQILGLRKISLLKPVVPFYKLTRKLNLDSLVKAILLPAAYKREIKELDVVT